MSPQTPLIGEIRTRAEKKRESTKERRSNYQRYWQSWAKKVAKQDPHHADVCCSLCLILFSFSFFFGGGAYDYLRFNGECRFCVFRVNGAYLGSGSVQVQLSTATPDPHISTCRLYLSSKDRHPHKEYGWVALYHRKNILLKFDSDSADQLAW